MGVKSLFVRNFDNVIEFWGAVGVKSLLPRNFGSGKPHMEVFGNTVRQ